MYSLHDSYRLTFPDSHTERIESFYKNQINQIFELVSMSAYGIRYIIMGGGEQPIEWWDPVYLSSQNSEAISRLTDKSFSDHLTLNANAFRIGFLQKLWMEISLEHPNLKKPEIVWRELSEFSSDPDYSGDSRLKLLVQAGLGVIAVIPCNICGILVMSIFAGRATVDRARIQSKSNCTHLINCACLLSSAITWKHSSIISTEERTRDRAQARRTFRAHMHAISWTVRDKDKVNSAATDTARCTSVINYLKRCRGAGKDRGAPPGLPLRHCLISSAGTFISFLIWSTINEKVKIYTNGRNDLVRGSFGALVASQYLLFTAPASQPLNAMLSQILCGFFSKLIYYVPYFAVWVRCPLTIAVVAFIMGITGTIHAPTAGEAFWYSYYGFDWFVFGTVLFNYAYAILMAVIINNLSVDRQYPYYWFVLQRLNKLYLDKKSSVFGDIAMNKINGNNEMNSDIEDIEP